MNPKLRLYINFEHRYEYPGNKIKETFAIFFPNHTAFLIKNYKFIKISIKESIIDESTIDQLMNTRNFIKLLEFDKENIEWYRYYYLGNDELKARISLMKPSCKELKLYKIYVYLNLLQQML